LGSGFVVDNLGVKWSLTLGFFLLSVARLSKINNAECNSFSMAHMILLLWFKFSRLAITFSTDVKVLLTVLYTILPLGTALGLLLFH
jgi:hypothetical protein